MPAGVNNDGLRYALVIVPTYNEALNIGPLCERILAVDPRLHVLVVDDDSPDGTAAVVRSLQAGSSGRVRCESGGACKAGRGAAVMRGLQRAIQDGYQFAIEMDADFSHDPDDIPRLLAVAAQADMVIGSRGAPGSVVVGRPLLRRLLHALGNLYARLLLGNHTTDQTNGFRLYRLSCLQTVPLHTVPSRGFAALPLGAYLFRQYGLRILDVPITFRERQRGVSKVSLRETVGSALDILRTRWSGTMPAGQAGPAPRG